MLKFGPKTETDPRLGKPCPACTVPFTLGDYTTLVPLGPGANIEARERARDGRPYNAVAIEVHWECSGIAYRVWEPVVE